MRRKGSGLCLIYGQKQCMMMIQEMAGDWWSRVFQLGAFFIGLFVCIDSFLRGYEVHHHK